MLDIRVTERMMYSRITIRCYMSGGVYSGTHSVKYGGDSDMDSDVVVLKWYRGYMGKDYKYCRDIKIIRER